MGTVLLAHIETTMGTVLLAHIYLLTLSLKSILGDGSLALISRLPLSFNDTRHWNGDTPL
jgi:hypothetical protein